MLHCVYNRILNLACRIFVSVNMKWCTKWALTLFKEETQLFSEKNTHLPSFEDKNFTLIDFFRLRIFKSQFLASTQFSA